MANHQSMPIYGNREKGRSDVTTAALRRCRRRWLEAIAGRSAQTTTYNEHVYAVRSGVNLLNYQLVPFILPDTLTINFLQFDDFSLGQLH